MKTKSIGFGEAVRSLAAEAGMQPFRFSNFDQKKELRFQTDGEWEDSQHFKSFGYKTPNCYTWYNFI